MRGFLYVIDVEIFTRDVLSGFYLPPEISIEKLRFLGDTLSFESIAGDNETNLVHN